MSEQLKYLGTIICPICGKRFWHNPMSIYKLIKKKGKGEVTTYYCSYTCWRKDGGDNVKRRYTKYK